MIEQSKERKRERKKERKKERRKKRKESKTSNKMVVRCIAKKFCRGKERLKKGNTLFFVQKTFFEQKKSEKNLTKGYIAALLCS